MAQRVKPLTPPRAMDASTWNEESENKKTGSESQYSYPGPFGHFHMNNIVRQFFYLSPPADGGGGNINKTKFTPLGRVGSKRIGALFNFWGSLEVTK